MTDRKKELAAIAGVMALISSDESLPFVQRPLENAPSVWQHYGRQQTMLHRELAQRRFIKRNR
ncbi:MAG: hypothetical protein WCY21_06485 [Candidatus Cloacimonadaceae bacterium]|jgi:hypothetical protein|nr:hypothetical protein [Candidatus Cloacimonadota bacterium]MDX9950002.1 hypothetical protein [Candidatus Syntrophosphaera sp.]NLN84937.1 hypothetical protein [Candidatus Cloacimonadota bacterium]